MEMGRITWKRSVVPVFMFGLAAVSGGKEKIEELDVVQRGWCRCMLEVPKGAPREFIDREMGMSDCKYRVVRARLKLAKRMIDRGGKARKSILLSRGGGLMERGFLS